MKEVIFINSHPIQYFAPLYKYMNEQGIKTSVWYGANTAASKTLDKEFGVNVQWDVPLLEGYEYRFFKNYSWKPSHENGFWGLMNLGMIKALFQIPKSVIIVHGWHYVTHLLILIFGRLAGHTVCLRCETPLKHEIAKTGWKKQIKYFLLKHIIFPQTDLFLYIGKQNQLFYQHFGIKSDRLLSCPYSVDNERFKSTYNLLKSSRNENRSALGISQGDKVIIYSGKYIQKKKPLEVLEAFRQLEQPNAWLIMIGEGSLRPQMEAFIAKHQLQQVILTGFINQSAIAKYYALGDLFVMYSGLGETWGLSVNEAMNFDLPIIVSTLTGCADDLVAEGVNGFVADAENIADLTAKIEKALSPSGLSFDKRSSKIVEQYSFATIVANLRAAFQRQHESMLVL